ncbi:MAG: recombinase zinc beta ribbon domain-containing protein [Bdellovibrio sp.]|nr:recombinase zinc beta ribbon domain-containing protein [Bdellovibrio sp.]
MKNQVQDRLTKNKNKYKPDEWKNHPFSLTELLVCGECGKRMGGKRGTGRSKEKHFYYGHAQIKNPFTKELAHECQIKNVRAFRIEEIVLNSLKQLLNDPQLIEKWVSIYRSKVNQELPEVQSRQKQIESEILATSKKVNNLVQRVSELPTDLPADLFYEQIRQGQLKIQELKLSKEKLAKDIYEAMKHEIDEKGFVDRIRRTIERLDTAQAEKQRPIFSNLLKFVEIHPMKIKIGMYVPAKEALKATGTDGIYIERTETQEKEGKLIPFNPTQIVGSSTDGNGAHGPRLEEPLTMDKTYPIQWRDSRLNLAELAKLRWIDGMDTNSLAKHFNKSPYAIENYYRNIRRRNYKLDGLTKVESERILWASKTLSRRSRS